MRVKFYADLYPGITSDFVSVYECSSKVPSEKSPGVIRYFFEVDFPIEKDAISLGLVTASKETPDRLSSKPPPWKK